MIRGLIYAHDNKKVNPSKMGWIGMKGMETARLTFSSQLVSILAGSHETSYSKNLLSSRKVKILTLVNYDD